MEKEIVKKSSPRKTVQLEDNVHKEAKQRALDDNTTIQELVNNAVRYRLKIPREE